MVQAAEQIQAVAGGGQSVEWTRLRVVDGGGVVGGQGFEDPERDGVVDSLAADLPVLFFAAGGGPGGNEAPVADGNARPGDGWSA